MTFTSMNFTSTAVTRKTGIRKFVYAAFLMLTALNFAPSLAAGQESVRGRFTLSHEVRWDNINVSAGEYFFSIDSNDAPRLMTLTKLDRSRTSFFLLVKGADQAKLTGSNRLTLNQTTNGVSWVNAMQLPEFGVNLYFAPPSTRAERQIAKAGTATAAAGQ
jgi:hypothetical protein